MSGLGLLEHRELDTKHITDVLIKGIFLVK